MNYTLSDDLAFFQKRINDFIQSALKHYPNARLTEAMAYAVLLGGKRVRPFLIYATGRMLGVSLDKLDTSAAAMESIHAYSLVHDDLPAMDDDALRRGNPTCHIAFDEATAILAGDALQSLAFSLISDDEKLTDSQKVAQISALATAAGAKGMCFGQSLDLIAEDKAVSLAELEQIHRNKTGALIEASVMMGLNLSQSANDMHIRMQLQRYAQAIGLAFQVQDDILDVIGETEKIGKQVGADEHLHKSTYPKLLGLEGAKQKAQDLYEQALDALAQLSFDTSALKALADFIIHRES